MQAEIAQYHVYINKLKTSCDSKKRELDHIKSSIDQTRLHHREAVAAATPEITAPVRLAPPPVYFYHQEEFSPILRLLLVFCPLFLHS